MLPSKLQQNQTWRGTIHCDSYFLVAASRNEHLQRCTMCQELFLKPSWSSHSTGQSVLIGSLLSAALKPELPLSGLRPISILRRPSGPWVKAPSYMWQGHTTDAVITHFPKTRQNLPRCWENFSGVFQSKYTASTQSYIRITHTHLFLHRHNENRRRSQKYRTVFCNYQL